MLIQKVGEKKNILINTQGSKLETFIYIIHVQYKWEWMGLNEIEWNWMKMYENDWK